MILEGRDLSVLQDIVAYYLTGNLLHTVTIAEAQALADRLHRAAYDEEQRSAQEYRY